jgi:hypothetical protein
LTVGYNRAAERVSDDQVSLSASLATDARRLSLPAAYAELSAALKNAAYERLATALHGHAIRVSAANSNNLLFDSSYLGSAPGIFAKNVSLVTNDEPPEAPATVSSIPEATEDSSPAPVKDQAKVQRAARIAASSPPAEPPPAKSASVRGNAATSSASAADSSQTPGLFERFIAKPYRMALAYASTGDAGIDELPNVAAGPNLAAGRYDRLTAVYDISAHTVYMPDGTRLEAHSGLGSRFDDPRHVDERMRGATPPNVYELQPREAPFHGVHALRLLAHSYMLGSRGDSNGCVSFKNYNAFLQAYNNNKVKRLAVVAHLE